MKKHRAAITALVLGLCTFLSPRIFIGQPAHRLAACAALVICVAIYMVSDSRHRE